MEGEGGWDSGMIIWGAEGRACLLELLIRRHYQFNPPPLHVYWLSLPSTAAGAPGPDYVNAIILISVRS